MFQKTEKVNFDYNRLADPKFSFYDKTLVDAVKNRDPWVHMFFRSLALCHTVLPDEKVKGEKGPRPHERRICQRAWLEEGVVCFLS